MKRILLLVFWCSASLWADAQALLGTTGLLHAPTADMQRDKTFLFGGNYLNTHPLSTHFRSSDKIFTFRSGQRFPPSFLFFLLQISIKTATKITIQYTKPPVIAFIVLR